MADHLNLGYAFFLKVPLESKIPLPFSDLIHRIRKCSGKTVQGTDYSGKRLTFEGREPLITDFPT
jgi:hypothetical protein